MAIGLLVAWWALVSFPQWRSPWGQLASVWAAAEALQQAGCGAATAWVQPTGADVCRGLVDEDFYRTIGSLTLAGLVVLWLNRSAK